MRQSRIAIRDPGVGGRRSFNAPLKGLRWAVTWLVMVIPACAGGGAALARTHHRGAESTEKQSERGLVAGLRTQASSLKPSGRTTMAWNDPIEQGISARQLSILAGYYRDATQRIGERLASTVRALRDQPDSKKHQFMRERLGVIQGIVARETAGLKARGSSLAAETVAASAEKGARQAEQQAGALLRQGHAPRLAASLSAGVDTGAIETIARDTALRLSAAAEQHAARAVSVFRSMAADTTRLALLSEPAVNEALVRGLISGDPREAQRATRLLFREPGESDSPTALEYRRLGARQIEVGGWTGTVREYSSMLVLTRTREATVAARHERLGSLGIGHVQITGRRSLNFCTRFLGLVCALTAEASEGGKYPLLSSLPGGGPPFHPRCSKGTAAYIVGVVSDSREAAAEQASERYRRDQASGQLTRPLKAA